MKNKILWIFIGIFIITAASGFSLGRYYTIRRNLSIYFKEITEDIPVEEVKRYREEMKRLKNLMEREQKDIILATTRGEIETMREHIDSISKVKREILILTTEHLHTISKTLPPPIRESFIERKLKLPKGPHFLRLYIKEPYPESEGDIPVLLPETLLLPPEIELMQESGDSYFKIGEYENAIEQYESIIMKLPKHVISIIEIGNAYRELSQYDEAKECYLKALEIEPNNLNVCYRLIELEISRKNLPEVKRYLDKVFKGFPNVHVIRKFHIQPDTEKITEEGKSQVQSQKKEED